MAGGRTVGPRGGRGAGDRASPGRSTDRRSAPSHPSHPKTKDVSLSLPREPVKNKNKQNLVLSCPCHLAEPVPISLPLILQLPQSVKATPRGRHVRLPAPCFQPGLVGRGPLLRG